jgi:mannose-6-phosphate isomerase-like protein (cupin superfamily)
MVTNTSAELIRLSSAWVPEVHEFPDRIEHRSWIVGAFMDPGDLRRTEDVEVKWGTHPAGDQRSGWRDEETRTTIVILVFGQFRIDLSGGDHVLIRQGDCAMWGPSVAHSWEAEKDSVVITIRWPSNP